MIAARNRVAEHGWNPAAIDGNDLEELKRWLSADDPVILNTLFSYADSVRKCYVGDGIYLRGLIEIGNFCRRACTYCGLTRENQNIPRYRMTVDEIVDAARDAAREGLGTVVLQSGEDISFTASDISDVISRIKQELDIAVTLSLGERTKEELSQWKAAGADRYLLRFETSDRSILTSIHPPISSDIGRMKQLEVMRDLGYEVGSGVMVGLYGQTYDTLAQDISLFKQLGLDMIGVGPFIPHPDTLLGTEDAPVSSQQVPATPEMVYKVLALTRIVCPEANIPATTALGTLDDKRGRMKAFMCGANVVMPNFTPKRYRDLYNIYPGKENIGETCDTLPELHGQVVSLGRTIGEGKGTSPAFIRRQA